MPRFFAAVLCFISLLTSAAHGQGSTVAPVRVAPGTVLKFHLQTRLNPTGGDALDALPKGTVLQVRMLDSIDSAAEVRGLLVLLRSRTHPEGFRYELLITGLTDRGKSYDLTASLNSSFLDPGIQPSPGPKSATR